MVLYENIKIGNYLWQVWLNVIKYKLKEVENFEKRYFY
ncbi:hypothetical protein CSCA_1068 [Clostridium scatologenes]|uniref:Uncharacterized protein n=1 Tax=Clostridium scatologenes TaxID=1548 RepID=A0A0E3JXH3_CLOSL|nr:hypothetical protein CSCA_1068 [Clostridium scatologenes]